MKKRISGVLAALSVLGVSCVYGGKNVAPVESPVAPIVVPWGLYAGLGLLWSDFDRDCPCGGGKRIGDNTYGLTGLIGYNFNKYLGVQGRINWAPVESDFMKMSNVGLYLKPQYPVTEHVNLYGLLGYGWSHLSCDCPGHPHHTHNVNGFQWGAGGEYFFNKYSIDGKRQGWSLWADYVNLMHNEGINNFSDNTWQIGIGYHF